jgi:hypothetical protein
VLDGWELVGRTLVEALRECLVLGARWREELEVGSVGVLAPLRREKVLFSDVSGGRLMPGLWEGGRMDALLLLVPGREIFEVRKRLAEAVVELEGFGNLEGD